MPIMGRGSLALDHENFCMAEDRLEMNRSEPEGRLRVS